MSALKQVLFAVAAAGVLMLPAAGAFPRAASAAPLVESDDYCYRYHPKISKCLLY